MPQKRSLFEHRFSFHFDHFANDFSKTSLAGAKVFPIIREIGNETGKSIERIVSAMNICLISRNPLVDFVWELNSSREWISRRAANGAIIDVVTSQLYD